MRCIVQLGDYSSVPFSRSVVSNLSNSMQLWAMPCRATQDGPVIVENSDKMWSTGEGNGNLLVFPLENSMDGGAWQAAVHEVTKSQTLPSYWTELNWIFHYIFFSCCSWGSQGNNTEEVCHSLLQWTTFCQNSSPWPVRLGWPYTAWLLVSLSRQGCGPCDQVV